ncbi:hypothetical protein [Bordetella sp. 02P26C-1]|uniref:hypothetical protein n=1 Tax=Bordetella sp. 02P26C-1 TaxID=2683195 RepID=UPI001354904B|nr:hypothetical protein [Bordetella sp. 02P26C-1]MVW79744.1 hypothetical protein [Bordetella sp. 02P26C-1]
MRVINLSETGAVVGGGGLGVHVAAAAFGGATSAVAYAVGAHMARRYNAEEMISLAPASTLMAMIVDIGISFVDDNVAARLAMAALLGMTIGLIHVSPTERAPSAPCPPCPPCPFGNFTLT